MLGLNENLKHTLKIFRMYRKCLGALCCKYPNDISWWKLYRHKMDGILDLLLFNTEVSFNDYSLIKKYVDKKMDELWACYFN